jgi:hypothetical protein
LRSAIDNVDEDVEIDRHIWFPRSQLIGTRTSVQ